MSCQPTFSSPKKRNISPPTEKNSKKSFSIFPRRRKRVENYAKGEEARRKERYGWMGLTRKTCVISRAEKKMKTWLDLSVSERISGGWLNFAIIGRKKKVFCRCKIHQSMLLHFCLLVWGHHMCFSEHKKEGVVYCKRWIPYRAPSFRLRFTVRLDYRICPISPYIT